MKHLVHVSVSFYSYFKDLTGCERATLDLAGSPTLGDLLQALISRFPRLGPMEKSTLMAVGVEYQDRRYVLKEGDQVALFPPVQGG